MSAIMYKFRASTNFESLPSMPGSTARLFDVKRAIVRAKKLDKSSGGPQLEFELSVKNAMTNEVYEDENMLLPRGSRLIVQRMPAARGNGLLAKIARANAGVSDSAGGAQASNLNSIAAQNEYYTVGSKVDDEDEFVDAAPAINIPNGDNQELDLAKLKAVTEQAGSMYRSNTTISRSTQPSKFGPAVGGLPPPTANTNNSAAQFKPHSNIFHPKPNADPELREKELRLAQQQAPKKRATGIPRTFLNSESSSVIEGVDGEDGAGVDHSLSRLQPNNIGFQALVNRGGGQSETGVDGKKHDLEYALKLTATSIPEHLQCGICGQVVKNAMFIPWDNEGRTACELCMRNGLAQNGFRCPLTGNEGVSPDNLLPNQGLRKATDEFVRGVMKTMTEIIEQQEADEEEERKHAATLAKKDSEKEFDDDENGIITKNRKNALEQHNTKNRLDDFGEDAFGGDVFEIDAPEENEEEEDSQNLETVEKDMKQNEVVSDNLKKSIADEKQSSDGDSNPEDNGNGSENITTNKQSNTLDVNSSPSSNEHLNAKMLDDKTESLQKEKKNVHAEVKGPESSHSTVNRRELLKNRRPPAGYKIGPAGGATVHGTSPLPVLGQQPVVDTNKGGNMVGGRGRGRGGGHGRFENSQGRGDNNQGRGNLYGGRGRGNGRFSQNKEQFVHQTGGRGRGYDSGFGRGNFQEHHNGRSGFQGRGPGRGGDFGGRGNPGRGNGQFYDHQGGQQNSANNSTNSQYEDQYGNNERSNKRPRLNSGDMQQNQNQFDGQFHDNWQNHGGQGRGFGQRGRGFGQRGTGYGQRGRGSDFQCNGRGGGGRFHNGRGRGDFSRGRGVFGRGRF